MDLAETGRNGVDWINVAQDRDKYRTLLKAVIVLFESQTKRKISWLSNYDTEFWCSEILCYIIGFVFHDVSKERVTFILKGQVDQEEVITFSRRTTGSVKLHSSNKYAPYISFLLRVRFVHTVKR